MTGTPDLKDRTATMLLSIRKPNPGMAAILTALLSTQVENIGAFSFQSSGSITSHRSVALSRPARLCHSSEVKGSEPQEELDEVQDDGNGQASIQNSHRKTPEWLSELKDTSPFFQFLKEEEDRKLPPMVVEDYNVLLYDVLLLINLSASISFWVVHRMDFLNISSALSEGSLLSLLWIGAGLYNGAFLYSAVDGHYNLDDERAGPRAAGMLGLHTFINTASLRVLLALITAFVEHRKVGFVPGEDLMPLEVACGLLLMSTWRMLHSSYTPRV